MCRVWIQERLWAHTFLPESVSVLLASTSCMEFVLYRPLQVGLCSLSQASLPGELGSLSPAAFAFPFWLRVFLLPVVSTDLAAVSQASFFTTATFFCVWGSAWFHSRGGSFCNQDCFSPMHSSPQGKPSCYMLSFWNWLGTSNIYLSGFYIQQPWDITL